MSDLRTDTSRAYPPGFELKPNPYHSMGKEAVQLLKGIEQDKDGNTKTKKVFQNGITQKELLDFVRKADQDGDGVLDPEKDKLAGQGIRLDAEDLYLINYTAIHCQDLKPNQIVFTAIKTSRGGPLKVASYELSEGLSLQDKAARVKADFSSDFVPEDGGCANMASDVITLVANRPLRANTLIDDPQTKKIALNGKMVDPPGDRLLRLKDHVLSEMIENRTLRPGMVILTNTDYSMQLPDKPSDKTDRHWFVYLGKDASGTPRFIDNLGYGKSDYEAKQVQTRQALWSQWMRNHQVPDESKNSAEYMEKFFARGFDGDYATNGRPNSNGDTVVHSIFDPFSEPTERRRFAIFAAELLGTTPDKVDPDYLPDDDLGNFPVAGPHDGSQLAETPWEPSEADAFELVDI